MSRHEARRALVLIMQPAARQTNRRRDVRFPLGLPATLHWVDLEAPDAPDAPTIVEIVDISSRGLRLRSLDGGVSVARRASLHFVLSDQRVCTAAGEVNRVGRSGSFVLALEESNGAFRGFVDSLGGSKS
jgi:hypothetical protein